VSDLPVLGPKDIDDVQNFAAKHGMDYIFASFVQCADDVRMIRKVRCGRSMLQRTCCASPVSRCCNPVMQSTCVLPCAVQGYLHLCTLRPFDES
jgi:hypothetical protein